MHSGAESLHKRLSEPFPKDLMCRDQEFRRKPGAFHQVAWDCSSQALLSVFETHLETRRRIMQRNSTLYLLLICLAGSHAAAANVMTEALHWRAQDIDSGLNRLKELFLDDSIGHDTEFVGAVLRTPDGGYQFTQGRGRPGQDQVTFRIRRPLGTELVGLWHTHGARGPTRAFFSPTDVALVGRTGLPFYLITPDGEIRVLRPEHAQKSDRQGHRLRGSLARLPRGSHPGERVAGKRVRPCPDVIEV
jgi:hypothetical protein